jgi:hypothetical protein
MNAPDRHVDERGLVVPPQAIEAEQSVLGALMLDNDAVDRIPELRAEHFYRYDHRVIFEHITRMIMAGRRADVITTYEALGTSGKDEQIGGLSYLNALAQNVPGSAGIRRYAEIVIERAQLRGILCAVDEIGAMVHNRSGKTASEIIAEAQEQLRAEGSRPDPHDHRRRDRRAISRRRASGGLNRLPRSGCKTRWRPSRFRTGHRGRPTFDGQDGVLDVHRRLCGSGDRDRPGLLPRNVR